MAGSLKLNAAISQLINDLKEKRKIGNRGLSSVVGISNPHVSRKLNSQYSWNLEEIEKLAEYFGYKDGYSFISKSKKYYGADIASVVEECANDGGVVVIYDGVDFPDDAAGTQPPSEAEDAGGGCEERFRRNEKGEIAIESIYGLAARTGDPREKEFYNIQDEPA